MTALRATDIMKHDFIGPKKNPVAVVVTYRSRKIASGKPYTYRTVVLSGAHDCVILDWHNEDEARTGHDQTLARVIRGEPLQRMLQ